MNTSIDPADVMVLSIDGKHVVVGQREAKWPPPARLFAIRHVQKPEFTLIDPLLHAPDPEQAKARQWLDLVTLWRLDDDLICRDLQMVDRADVNLGETNDGDTWLRAAYYHTTDVRFEDVLYTDAPDEIEEQAA